MIDLRSDTVTKPTEEMRKAMAWAEVGDDVYGEDPTINKLQEYTADLLGKEDAIFVPSGTMSNQLCVAGNTNPGEEIICEAEAHIYYYENAGAAYHSGVQVRPVFSEKGMPDLQLVEKTIRPDVYYFPRTSMFCLENTHNRHGGSVLSLDYIKEASEFAAGHGLIFHLDGARLWNACSSTGIPPKEYAKHFDTLSVCLSKGLGAPAGSLAVGSREFIKKLRKLRKLFGGGMRQAGILAAAGLHALKHHLPLLGQDHMNAVKFAQILSNCEYAKIDPATVESNMVVFGISDKIAANDFEGSCKEKGLNIMLNGPGSVRAVFHFQVTPDDTVKAAEIVTNVLNKLSKSYA